METSQSSDGHCNAFHSARGNWEFTISPLNPIYLSTVLLQSPKQNVPLPLNTYSQALFLANSRDDHKDPTWILSLVSIKLNKIDGLLFAANLS